ncbi:MAG: hypothetical protein COA42_23445 [Alteromonadaceae bacterium]|nr:MAG: hypothetical protein COA42_23445 [Alteromonadaceae bacterium]
MQSILDHQIVRGTRSLVLVLLLAVLSVNVFALGLSEAKVQGLIGEQRNGYLGVVKAPASAEVKALLVDINAKRKRFFEKTAKDNGQTLTFVEQRAGEAGVRKTKLGNYIQSLSGKWVKK